MEKKIQNFNSSIFLFFFTLTLIVSFVTRTVAQPNTTIYLDSTKQVIRGYGAANIVGWRPDMTNSEIETAFGTGIGQLGFSILRLRISPDSTQWSVNVPAAKKAYDKGVLIFASPWTPPASMKTNNNTVGGELKESSYADYAAHLRNFADYMAMHGVQLYAVSLQNEPDITVSYESCDWNSSQFIKFLRENAPSIGYRIIAPESFQFRHVLSDPILNDPLACANLDIVGGHIYGGGLTTYPLAKEKGKEVWMTEHYTESAHSANIWSLAIQVGLEIHQVMMANMSSYVWWYIVRYYGPIGDGEKSVSFPNEDFAQKGEVTKRGYVMSQFSRFIRPGYMRVDATANPQAGVYVTAYKSDSKVVVVVINNIPSSIDQTFVLWNGSVTKFTPYVTSETKNCEQGSDILVADGSFTATLGGSSVTTFVSDATLVPVEFISFTAYADNDKIQLSWVTATEKNNRGFEIQRSIDKNKFVTIGYVEGKGTSTEGQAYSFVDYASGEKLYYRLKQRDFSGTFEYSNIIEVSTVPLTFSLFQNFPNPFNPVTQIKYSLPENAYVSLKVYNLLGEEVATSFEGNRQAGYYIASFNGTGLADGVYLYQLKANNFIETKKLILLK